MAQPFGLLSSKAVVDFTVGSRVVPNHNYAFKHGNWKTVTQYVYVNMFKDEKYRHRMSETLHCPFENMIRLREQEDLEIYNEAILKGLSERFKQHDELRKRLYQTRGKQLVYDNKDILMLLNNMRAENKQLIYDPKQGKDVCRTEVLQVISGVEDELAKNPSLPDTLDFVALKKYAKRYGYRNIALDDEIFLDINQIVPVLKYRMRGQLWNEEVSRFKDHLLDVFLDYILENEYPNLDQHEYAEAKRQQIEKETRLQVYKDQLYDMYMKGRQTGDNYDHIMERLQFTPDKTIRKMGRDACDISKKLLGYENKINDDETDIIGPLLRDMDRLHTSTVTEVEKIYLSPDDPFLPNYIEDVVIDSRRYVSVVHYAYAKMIANLINIGELSGLEMFDINTVALKDIVGMYNNIKRDWIEHNLKVNNEAATYMKFIYPNYSTLVHLLIATCELQLVWNDKSDPVLGVGRDGKGDNNTGQLLMYMRNMNRPSLNDPFISSYGSIAANVWTNSWMMSMAQDLKNTMMLLMKPSTSKLEAIYNVHGVKASMGNDDAETLYKAGLNDDQIAIVFPVILGMYIPMQSKTESQLIKDEVAVYFMENDYRGRRNDLNKDFEIAKSRLGKISKMFQLADGVDQNKFVLSILANRQTSNKNDLRWDRVYKWSH